MHDLRILARVVGVAVVPLLLSSLARGQSLAPPPVPSENPITEAKRVLGKALFWDEQLSSDNTMACGTCHVPGVGGSDPRMPGAPNDPGPDGLFGTGDDGFGSAGVIRQSGFGHYAADVVFGFDEQVTGRLSPSVFLAAYAPELFWDGRASGTFVDPATNEVSIPSGGALENQSLGPLLSDVEMARSERTLDDVNAKLVEARPLALASDLPPDLENALAGTASYPDLFAQAFGDARITSERIAFALATYQRTLIPNASKFDRVMAGQAVFTPPEQQGFNAFRSPGSRCNVCHTPPLFSDNAFHNLGLRPIVEDTGRQAVTGLAADRGRFKTPSLRNVALREQFFHTGAPNLGDLTAVLAFYNGDGGPFANNKSPLLANLTVPVPVRDEMVLFLDTLTDPRVAAEQFPFDRPTLFSEVSGEHLATYGEGVVGSGDFAPQMIATTPPKAGSSPFKLGLHAALGGGLGLLAVSVGDSDGADGLPVPLLVDPAGMLFFVVPVAGVGPGGGTATLNTSIPADFPIGIPWFVQWVVLDPAAPNGVGATSEAVRIDVF